MLKEAEAAGATVKARSRAPRIQLTGNERIVAPIAASCGHRELQMTLGMMGEETCSSSGTADTRPLRPAIGPF